jgi:hypothetical protein
MVVHVSNPRLTGGKGRRIMVSDQPWAKTKQKNLILKITKAKKDWRHWTSGRVPA